MEEAAPTEATSEIATTDDAGKKIAIMRLCYICKKAIDGNHMVLQPADENTKAICTQAEYYAHEGCWSESSPPPDHEQCEEKSLN